MSMEVFPAMKMIGTAVLMTALAAAPAAPAPQKQVQVASKKPGHRHTRRHAPHHAAAASTQAKPAAPAAPAMK